MMWAFLLNRNSVLFVLFMVSTLYKMWQTHRRQKDKRLFLTRDGDIYTK